MSKVERLLKSINAVIKAKEEDEEITDVVPDFPGLDKIPKYIEDYEKKVAKLFRNQRKHFLNGVKDYIQKDITIEGLLNFLSQDLFASDEFLADMEETTKDFLFLTITELTSEIMDAIDKDVAFSILSTRTTDWIDSWSHDLGEIMKLNTHQSLEDALKKVIEEGGSIADAELAIKDLPQFDRLRARTTAITEILTASSRSQWEAYMQSPAVTKKSWKHSGGKKNNPRKEHEDLDGTEIGVDEKFDVNGNEADYPRDPSLPASERVNCHCALGPVVDQDIIGLSKEEKEVLRQQVLDEMNT
ncbi:phage minor head protein [Bacillus sp. 1NLA3E]|uniref:phage minor head protein n=1 Tax=Bacillus sp. 1NLA3E TaxID=666686 RepID=UPI000247E656|nr:phage minor head protein [Bacillus sp. 1NLA3E]AGK52024.1 phage Mu protein F like protein [Bacillus sp. 1NLA3E]